MNDRIELDRQLAEELEVLLRLVARASQSIEDFHQLQEADLPETACTFADALEDAIEEARQGYGG